jgi:hypothetical protein
MYDLLDHEDHEDHAPWSGKIVDLSSVILRDLGRNYAFEDCI